jgi:hypothetical protein
VTQATRKLLEESEALPEPERSELVAELAGRGSPLPHDAPRDEDLVATARAWRRTCLRTYNSRLTVFGVRPASIRAF